jgi:ABC-type multidrug transport system ATPase subunit
VREEVAAMVEDIQLMDKKDTQASKLSGGMKRKLRYNIMYK